VTSPRYARGRASLPDRALFCGDRQPTPHTCASECERSGRVHRVVRSSARHESRGRRWPPDAPTYVHFNVGPAQFALGQYEPVPSSGVRFNFEVDDVDAWWERLRSTTAVLEELTDTPYGTRKFTILDPDGNQLGFVRAQAEAHVAIEPTRRWQLGRCMSRGILPRAVLSGGRRRPPRPLSVQAALSPWSSSRTPRGLEPHGWVTQTASSRRDEPRP
jgi:Glyoxalase/Bleomycin resistance protein/Dioxygenase superfamily